MQLSQRLSSVASMVTAGNCLADVGTDHGYVPIYLYERNIIPRAIAMDVNQGPLERAKLHIEESGMGEVIETRLSDGFSALKPGEVDAALIAGMGGPLMIRILSTCPEVTASLKELILQPQSEIENVRRWLYEQGYEITKEHMVLEEGKYYPMFRAVKNPDAEKLSDLEYQFGRVEVLEERSVLKSYLVRELEGKREILEKLQAQDSDRARVRACELKERLESLEQMLGKIAVLEEK